jgi:hypothetical protein
MHGFQVGRAWRLRAIVGAVAGLLLLSAIAPSPSGAGTGACSHGDARSLFQNTLAANEILLRQGLAHPRAETLATCQWRFYWEDGHPIFGDIRFSDEDIVLGGIVFGFDGSEGLTRSEAAAELTGIQVRTWLAQVEGGEAGVLIEQPLMSTPVFDFQATLFAGTRLIVKSWGFITQLPPGEYRIITEVRHSDPGNSFWDFDWAVDFEVVPAATG